MSSFDNSVLSVWNRALSLLPHDWMIQDINESSTEAIRCRSQWDSTRHALIASHCWGWLQKATPICCGSKSEAIRGWFEYGRPANTVRLIGLFDPRGHQVSTETINGVLVSPSPLASVRYLPDCPDPGKMPTWFVDALVHELAFRLSPMIKGSTDSTVVLQQLAQKAKEDAWGIDAQESQSSGDHGLNRYIDARR